MSPEELATYLTTIRHAVASTLRPDLKSDQARSAAGAIVALLDRINTTLRHGQDESMSRLPTWQSLIADLGALGFDVDPGKLADSRGFLGAVAAVSAGMLDAQRALRDETTFEQVRDRLATNDEGMTDWYRRAVAALVDHNEAGEPRIPEALESKHLAAAPEEEAERLRSALGAYLRLHYPQLPDEPIAKLHIAPGGHVKQTAIFRLVPNSELPERLVLRRDLPLSITGATVLDEYPIIKRAFEVGLPVPQPILVEDDESVLGGRFMIMTEVADAVGAGTYFPEERRLAPRTVGPDFGKEVASVLARLHTATAIPGAQGGNLSETVSKSLAAWRTLPQLPYSLTAELSYLWLLSHPLPDDRPRCLVHGDVGSHNIMVRDGHLAALLDWEIAHDGDPAEDLAQCRMMLLPDVMPWPEFKREYIAAGGDPVACEEEAVAYYCIWTYIKHGLMNGTVRDLYLRGERDDMVAAIVAGHYYLRLMQYQARALAIAVEAAGER
jgi:aminoglycoside phosphotransferase (APT) family kinase protein